ARGTSAALASRRQHLVAGARASGSSADVRAAFGGRIGEMINGVPTRVWDFTAPSMTGTPSAWNQSSIALFAGDRVDVSPRVTLDAAIRFETIRAGNTAAAQRVSSNDVMPRGGMRIALTDRLSTAAFAFAGRYGHRLP